MPPSGQFQFPRPIHSNHLEFERCDAPIDPRTNLVGFNIAHQMALIYSNEVIKRSFQRRHGNMKETLCPCHLLSVDFLTNKTWQFSFSLVEKKKPLRSGRVVRSLASFRMQMIKRKRALVGNQLKEDAKHSIFWTATRPSFFEFLQKIAQIWLNLKIENFFGANFEIGEIARRFFFKKIHFLTLDSCCCCLAGGLGEKHIKLSGCNNRNPKKQNNLNKMRAAGVRRL